MPLNPYPTNGNLETIVRERSNDAFTVDKLERGKMPGRIVTLGRAIPASATDVVAGDGEGDMLTDTTYTYTLIKVSNVLKWNRIAHSVGW